MRCVVNKTINALIIFLLPLALFFVFSGKNVSAGSEHNVSGWAWSETIGWISFNSANQGAGANYGVNVDSGGLISGFAWAETIGWISFNQSDLSGCPSGTCEARFTKSTGQVSGWARAYRAIAEEGQTLGGWDGWISLSGANYGVSVSECEWDGYAWGSDVVGWVHFRGSNYGVSGSNDACSNRLPSAVNLSVTQPDYCQSGPTGFYSWQFTDLDQGDSQSAYRIQVDNNSDFSSPEDDSGKVISSSQNYATPLGKLSYNATYYWRLMVWDQPDANSIWISGPSFTTPLHAYPEVNFSWSPFAPSQEGQVQFADQTQVFGGAGISSWFWTFQDGSPPSSSAQNPQIVFNSAGTKNVTLEVTDIDGFSCQKSKSISVYLPVPGWREIAPF